MTKSVVFVSEKQLFNLMATNTKFTGHIPKPIPSNNKQWTGRQLLSTILPPNVNYKGANKSFDENKPDGDKENYVIVENGEILQGRVDTKVYQDRTKGLIHSIYNEYGPDETRQFFDNTQQLICNWLVRSGFSVGISDLVVDEETVDSLKSTIRNMKVDVYKILHNIHEGNFENKTRKSNNDKFEEEVNKLLNDATNKAGKIGLQKIDDLSNRMLNMIKSGAKGNVINIAQMIGCVGQQNVDGRRIAYGYDNRTLPHYTKYDDGPESRGFVENSFIKGLTPQEFFFHSMGGREGLIDTAVKSVTGDTPIVIIENGVSKYVKIGDWIDAQLTNCKDQVAHYPEDRNLEMLDITKNNVFIPTTDEDGNVTWGDVTAITRHDPGTELYQIKTKAGKDVIVTAGKSMLIWHPDTKKFKEVLSPDLKIGDFVPVTANLATPPIVVEHVDMCEYFTDKFELNKDNGIFIGLFLSEGHACQGNMSVNITNNDPDVKQFVKSWFDKYAISHHEDTTSGVCGYSMLLTRFLTRFVGHDARNKHVPDVAFVAPEEFVVGLLNGYFTGDGTIGKANVDAGSASARLTEGISMLCTRLGIFGKVFTTQLKEHRISIRGQWAKAFADKIDLSMESKNQQLKEMASAETQRSFDWQNDVVLDEITDIKVLGVEKYPKMYDLTIPSTLNFGLANGLHVVDTSATGYIQRKLVKAMEDCKVSYDMTVRNANGNIVQFLYGEDGMDAIKIENQHLYYITKTPEELENDYLISVKDDLSLILDKPTWKAFNENGQWETRMFEHYKQICQDREYIIKKMFNGEQETSVLYPISFTRIITNTHALYKKYKCTNLLSDLNPLDVLDEIDKLTKELFLTKNNAGNKLLGMLLRMYLSPKQMILNFGFNRTAFEQIVAQVKMRFYDSIVNPSEMVGVVAAQSIGEPCTQISTQVCL